MFPDLPPQKPQTIRTIGLIIAIIAGFIVMSNTMGMLAVTSSGMMDEFQATQMPSEPEFDFLNLIISNYVTMCMIMIAFGVLYLIGGIYLRNYKLWANRLLTIVTIVVITAIWMGSAFVSIRMTGAIFGLNLVPILFWTAIHGLLIWYLNKKSVRMHFD